MLANLVLRAVLASLIVGFVTASIKLNMDRFFLVILLVFLIGMPLEQAILVNLLVLLVAAVILYARQGRGVRAIPRDFLVVIAASSAVGGVLGRLLGLSVPPSVLMILFGIYAIGVGLRLVLVKPNIGAAAGCSSGRLVPLFLFFSVVTGMLSAGGKPFKIPILNLGFGFPLPRAYMLSSVGVAAAVASALATQLVIAPGSFTGEILLWSAWFAVSITLVSLLVEKFWTPTLQKWVSLAISPVLVIVGVRFLLLAMA